MEKVWTRILRSFRYGYLRIVRIKAPAESIALGLALGVFVGCMPLLSLQMVVAVFLALLLRASKVAAALGTWWTNPFNWAIVFPLFYMLGRVFVPGEVVPLAMSELTQAGLTELFQRGGKWLLITSLGGTIAGIPLAMATYFFTLRAVRMYHNVRAVRRRERQRAGIRND
ncbi:MAG: DUF2062 domain-containing protein [Deltaproteobacteria bacterium]|nr:DUF2062 domain-containing protein [Deltaproteobacteria bacterium]